MKLTQQQTAALLVEAEKEATRENGYLIISGMMSALQALGYSQVALLPLYQKTSRQALDKPAEGLK